MPKQCRHKESFSLSLRCFLYHVTITDLLQRKLKTDGTSSGNLDLHLSAERFSGNERIYLSFLIFVEHSYANIS